MTIRKNPGLGDDEGRQAFVGRVANGETKRLHCLIPAELHRDVKRLSVEEDTDMTALVTQALRELVASRRR